MHVLKKHPLLVLSIAILLFFSIFLYFFTSATYTYIATFSLFIRQWFGPFYLWLGLGCVLLLLVLGISRLGKRRLGNASDRPEFSRLAWISMLYSAGMGAGILLRAVQEPVYMYQHPPIQTGATAATIALEYTFYQWGFTAWAFYALFAISIGYYIFTQSKKIIPSTAFSGLATYFNSHRTLKNVYLFIDVLAILTTVFGLVAAIGLGTTQIRGGLTHLLHQELGITTSILLLLLIAGLAFISVYNGVQKGIKQLSTWNIYATLALLFFVLIQSDIIAIFTQFFTALYHYCIDFIPLSIAYGQYNPGTAFLTDWTYYYWAFWLAWAPFTGIFIARISKGRTLRELIIGVLLIPSLGTFFWFTTFGESAFQLLSTAASTPPKFDNVFTSIFLFFEQYPFQGIINGVVIALLISFLVTSLDSAIFVLSMFTDGGNHTPAKKHRILWSIILTLFAIGILLLGNSKADSNILVATQKLLIITSLPFALLMIVMSVLFLKDFLKKESYD